MARAPLNNANIPDPVLDAITIAGAAYVYAAGSTTAATVYAAATGSTALTQPATFVHRDGLRGWVEPGTYRIGAGNRFANIDVGDTGSAPVVIASNLRDYSLGYQTLGPLGLYMANTNTLAMTSGTVQYQKLEPVRHAFVFNTFVSHSGGTAAA